MPVYLIEGRGGSGKSLYVISLIHKYMKLKSFLTEKRRIYLVNFDSTPLLHEKFPQVERLSVLEDVFKDFDIQRLKFLYENDFPDYLKSVENFDVLIRPGLERQKRFEKEYILSCRAFCVEHPVDGNSNMRNIFPDGSLVIFDEAHDYFRAKSRPTNSHPSDFMKFLATCRHFGLDFYFITQDSKKLDPEIRRNITYHHYLVRLFNSPVAKIKIFEEICDNPQRSPSLLKKRIVYKKSFFPLYNSTSMDTFGDEVAAKTPVFKFAMPFIGLGVALFIFWNVFTGFDNGFVSVSNVPIETPKPLLVGGNENPLLGTGDSLLSSGESKKASVEDEAKKEPLEEAKKVTAWDSFTRLKQKPEKLFIASGKHSLDNYFLSGLIYGEKIKGGIYLFKKFEFLSTGKLAGCRDTTLNDMQELIEGLRYKSFPDSEKVVLIQEVDGIEVQRKIYRPTKFWQKYCDKTKPKEVSKRQKAKLI